MEVKEVTAVVRQEELIKCTNKTSPVPCEVKSIGPKIGQLHRKRKR